MWLLDAIRGDEDGEGVERALKALVSVLVERADREVEYLMPGYTHLQVRTTLHIIYQALFFILVAKYTMKR